VRIGVRLQLPAIFDTGGAEELLGALRAWGEVEAVVTGTMARTALLDAGMEEGVRFFGGGWEAWIREASLRCDLVVNASHASSPLKMQADCWHLVRRIERRVPFLGVDTRRRTVVPWTEGAKGFALVLARERGFRVEDPVSFEKVVWEEGGKRYRKILGVEEGDYVLVEGRVVGRARGEVRLVEGREGVEVLGVEGKKKALGRLEGRRLEEVRVVTLSRLRGRVHRRRRLEPPKGEEVVFVDHAGYGIYEHVERGIRGAVTVGDDTTSVVGDLLSRYFLPIVGVVDGDEDGLLDEVEFAPGSVLLQVEEDDSFGREVFQRVFRGEVYLRDGMEEVGRRVRELAEERGVLRGVLAEGER
jgi:hypothetical protein